MGHILINNLCKEYIDRRRVSRKPDESGQAGTTIPVLDNVNLEFLDGELVCILGPSGCGKSTMLNIVAGFSEPTSGNVLINDKQITGPSSDNIFVFQQNGLLPWMTVWQNVELGLRHIQDVAEKHEKIQEHIDMVGLENFERHYPYQLSGGMKRRAELARALVVNPDVLIMDEPFTGLDFLTHMKMREEVVNMHHLFGKSILIVTHDIDDALIMGDRVVVMSDRPAKVELNQKIEFSHPRSFVKQLGLRRLREDTFLMLGVSHAV